MVARFCTGAVVHPPARLPDRVVGGWTFRGVRRLSAIQA